ncbi:MAG: cation acetate symporter, partial [Solibacillus sp.]
GSIIISIVSIVLALGAQTLNVAFLVSLAFCIAASSNLPVIIYTIYWKRFNTNGAVAAMLTGLISALILVAVSPNVWNPVAGKAIFVGTPLIDLTNPAIISVPLGFLGGVIGTLLSKEKDEAKYREVEVKAQTGISVQDASH